MKKILIVAAVLLVPLTASAQRQASNLNTTVFINPASTNKFNLIEGAALNGAPTATLDLKRRWQSIRVSVFLTARSSATTVTAALSCSVDGTNYAPIQARSISSGTATLDDFTDSKAVAGVDEFQVSYGVGGCEKAQIVFGGAGAGAGDLVNVQVIAIAGE